MAAGNPWPPAPVAARRPQAPHRTAGAGSRGPHPEALRRLAARSSQARIPQPRTASSPSRSPLRSTERTRCSVSRRWRAAPSRSASSGRWSAASMRSRSSGRWRAVRSSRVRRSARRRRPGRGRRARRSPSRSGSRRRRRPGGGPGRRGRSTGLGCGVERPGRDRRRIVVGDHRSSELPQLAIGISRHGAPLGVGHGHGPGDGGPLPRRCRDGRRCRPGRDRPSRPGR